MEAKEIEAARIKEEKKKLREERRKKKEETLVSIVFLSIYQARRMKLLLYLYRYPARFFTPNYDQRADQGS